MEPEVTTAVAIQSAARTYKVWLSAESTINATVEIEADSETDALDRARDYATEQPGAIDWMYEGSGDVILDPHECWTAELIPIPPTREERTRAALENIIGKRPLILIRHGQGLRIIAGTHDRTAEVAAQLGFRAVRDKEIRTPFIPSVAAANIVNRINVALGREVTWTLIG